MTKYRQALTVALLLFDGQTGATSLRSSLRSSLSTGTGADLIQNEMLKMLLDQIKQGGVENNQMVQLSNTIKTKSGLHQRQSSSLRESGHATGNNAQSAAQTTSQGNVQTAAQAAQAAQTEKEDAQVGELSDQALMYQLAASTENQNQESIEKHHSHK